ncbi:hypothetical protein BJ322DRAFT_1172217 [Thelephora terrestris]|uniref:Uncharacterized protein n=1 Tax=Thelephora terrestris TaxID=56493 RepID=A0A9P6H5X0_9AGAM|nr:hypothetical protein BJ322DRAFT_1172217 [Thelephora terrestris]
MALILRLNETGSTTNTLTRSALSQHADTSERVPLYLKLKATLHPDRAMVAPAGQFYDDSESPEELDSSPTEGGSIVDEIKVEAAKLRAENRVLKSTVTVGQGQTSSTASSVSLTASSEDKATLSDFRAAGKQFAILGDLWPQRGILRRPCPPRLKPLDPWNFNRCANDATWDEGNVAELYQLLPERYHDLIEHSALFSEQFIKGAGHSRIYLIDTVRRNASKIYSLGPTISVDFYSKDYHRATVPMFVNLLGSHKKKDEQYALYPRVLFTNYEVSDTELFGSPAILNILKAMLRGPTSVGSASTQRSGPKGSAHTWDLKSITPGCIAMAAVVAQFIISPDHVFMEKGGITKINYRNRFKVYKKFIIRNADTPRMKRLVAQLNADLLHIHSPDNEVTPSSTGEPDVTDEEADFCHAFQNEVVLSGSTEDVHTVSTTSPISALSTSVSTRVEPVPSSTSVSVHVEPVLSSISVSAHVELVPSTSNPDTVGGPPPTRPGEPPAVPGHKEGAAGKPTMDTEENPKRRSARKAGGATKKGTKGKAVNA